MKDAIDKPLELVLCPRLMHEEQTDYANWKPAVRACRQHIMEQGLDYHVETVNLHRGYQPPHSGGPVFAPFLPVGENLFNRPQEVQGKVGWLYTKTSVQGFIRPCFNLKLYALSSTGTDH